MGMGKMVYFDNAATTKLLPEVSDFIKENLDTMWMNPSSAYRYEIKEQIEVTRSLIKSCIGADEDDYIIFTSGGSEANSMINGSVVIPTTTIEHDSMYAADSECPFKVDGEGFVIIPDGYISRKFISVQLANNEIGTIQDLKAIREAFPNKLIHTDAVQAIGHIPVNVKELGVDALSASAHKFGGPKGVGFLYVSKEAYDYIEPLIIGTQENGMRGSTYNAIGIIAMGMALKNSVQNMFDNTVQTVKVRNEILEEMSKIPCAHLNGTNYFLKRLPGNLNYRFDGYRGEELQMFLADHDIYVSTGSACNTASGKPSHVLKAIGLSDEEANSSIRISVDHNNTEHEALEFIGVLKEGIRVLHHEEGIYKG